MKVACRCAACGHRSSWEIPWGIKVAPFLAQVPCKQCRSKSLRVAPLGPEVIKIGTLGSRAVSR